MFYCGHLLHDVVTNLKNLFFYLLIIFKSILIIEKKKKNTNIRKILKVRSVALASLSKIII